MVDYVTKIIYDLIKDSNLCIDKKEDIGKHFVNGILKAPYRYQYLVISVPDGRIFIPSERDPQKTLLGFGELLNTIRKKYPEVWKLFEKAGVRFEKDC